MITEEELDAICEGLHYPTFTDPGHGQLRVKIGTGTFFLSSVVQCIRSLGALQRKIIPKIRDYYGSGWVGPGVILNFFFLENSPKPVLIFWSRIP